MSDWKPIESAPRDGTAIKVKFKDIPGWDGTVKWWTDHTGKKGSKATRLRNRLIEKHGGYWGSAGKKSKPCKVRPTHWQPLPDPPTD